MKHFIKFIIVVLFFVSAGYIYGQTNFVVQVSDFAFTPENITITVGDTVTFQWAGGFHTTTSDSTTGLNAWNSPINSNVQVFKVVIVSPGLHRYYCLPHGGPGGAGMAGTITANAGGPTSVKEISNLADSYKLDQNYPNPFNPSTIINYAIPENAFVTLKIFNVLGEEVTTLVNEVQGRGTYSVDFNAAGLTSGIYFYRIKAGNFVTVKKMTLVK